MWREQNKEDVAHLLEEVWCIELEETFYNIFNKLAIRGIDNVVELSKEDLESVTWKDDNSYLSSLINNEVGDILNLMQHIEHLKQKGEFPSEAHNFRHNIITQESYLDFKGSSICTKKSFNNFKSIYLSKMELDHHLNLTTPETLESHSETTKQSSSTLSDDFTDQEFKLGNTLTVSSCSDINSLRSDYNSSDSDSKDSSDYYSKDSSSYEEETQTCKPSISSTSKEEMSDIDGDPP